MPQGFMQVCSTCQRSFWSPQPSALCPDCAAPEDTDGEPCPCCRVGALEAEITGYVGGRWRCNYCDQLFDVLPGEALRAEYWREHEAEVEPWDEPTPADVEY